jgi:O-antigen/teichoic acid export membrane protein
VIAALSVLSVIPQATWAASESAKKFVAVNMLASFVNVIGALLLIALARIGVLGLFWAKVISLVIVAVPYLRYLVRRVGIAFSWSDLAGAFAFSMPLVPHLVAHWVLHMADRYLIGRQLGLAAVGIYASAYAFTEAVNTVAVSANRAWTPGFTRAYGKPEERHFVARSITYLLVGVGGAATVLTVISSSVVRTFYSQRYAEAADLAPILAVAGLFQAIYYVYAAGLFYHRKNLMMPFVTVGAAVVNIGVNLLLIPELGLRGAALATLAAYLALTLGVRWACRRVTRLPFETGRIAKAFGVLVPVTGLGLACDLLPGLGLGWALKLALILITPLLLHALRFFQPEEIAWVMRRVKRVGAARARR